MSAFEFSPSPSEHPAERAAKLLIAIGPTRYNALRRIRATEIVCDKRLSETDAEFERKKAMLIAEYESLHQQDPLEHERTLAGLSTAHASARLQLTEQLFSVVMECQRVAGFNGTELVELVRLVAGVNDHKN